MEKNEIIILEDRGFIQIKGPEAKEFLQNIVTNDLNKVTSESTVFSSKGKKQTLGIGRKDRGRYTRLVGAVIESECFKKFSTKQFSEINKLDVRLVLQCGLETPSEKARGNLEALQRMATALNKIQEYEKLATGVLEFLKYIEDNWEALQND